MTATLRYVQSIEVRNIDLIVVIKLFDRSHNSDRMVVCATHVLNESDNRGLIFLLFV